MAFRTILDFLSLCVVLLVGRNQLHCTLGVLDSKDSSVYIDYYTIQWKYVDITEEALKYETG